VPGASGSLQYNKKEFRVYTTKDSKTIIEKRGFLGRQKAEKGMGVNALVELCNCCSGKITATPGLQYAALAKLGNP